MEISKNISIVLAVPTVPWMWLSFRTYQMLVYDGAASHIWCRAALQSVGKIKKVVNVRGLQETVRSHDN